MKKASEYRQHAEECRALARNMTDDAQRDQLVRMAETWDRLAAEREDKPPRQPALVADPDDAKGG